MSPIPHSALLRRDVSSLTTGQIAGIIVGIVVVALILLGIFIWRFLSYRKDFGPYTARGREASARQKALAQARGHIRSTRPKVTDANGFDEKTGLVASASKQRDLENGMHDRHPSPIQEDTNSINGTVADREQDDIAASKGKHRQQQIDSEIFQGHHATSAPVMHDTLPPAKHEADVNLETTEQNKGGLRQGCTTM